MTLDLKELAGACEKAAGKIRTLDGDIFQALGGESWDRAYRSAQIPCGAPEKMATEDARYCAPQYTSSIDAAMTLRPAGWSYQLKTSEHHENGFQFECWVSWGPIAYQRISSQAQSEALAICAGWLRAHLRDASTLPPADREAP
jgi:hypothetical protein